jgi:hypothetical protein
MDGPAGSSSSSSLPSSHAIQNEEADVISEQLEEPSCARQQHAEKPTSQPLRQLAHIHCVSSDAWSDALHQSQGGSIDCAVEVRVDVQTAAAVKQVRRFDEGSSWRASMALLPSLTV